MLCKLLSEVTNRVHKFQATKEPIQQMQVKFGTLQETLAVCVQRILLKVGRKVDSSTLITNTMLRSAHHASGFQGFPSKLVLFYRRKFKWKITLHRGMSIIDIAIIRCSRKE